MDPHITEVQREAKIEMDHQKKSLKSRRSPASSRDNECRRIRQEDGRSKRKPIAQKSGRDQERGGARDDAERIPGTNEKIRVRRIREFIIAVSREDETFLCERQ